MYKFKVHRWSSGWESTLQYRGHWFDLWSRRIPHAEEQLGLLCHNYCALEPDSGTPLQSSCLENPTDGGAWWAVVHGVAKSQARLNDFTFTFHFMHRRRKWQPTPVFLPGTGEPGGLPSMGSYRVGHDWSDLAVAAAEPDSHNYWAHVLQPLRPVHVEPVLPAREALQREAHMPHEE